MKKMTVFLLLAIVVAFPSISQENNKFLFRNYRESTVFFSNGRQAKEKINVNLLDGQLYFIDRTDNQVKIVNNSLSVDSIMVGRRKFFIDDRMVKEIISATPLVYAQYKAKTKMKAPAAGYGGTSEISSVTTYSELRDDGTQFLKEQEREVTNVYPVCWIVKDKKERKFSSAKEFLKIYPKQANLLKTYLDTEKIDFENTYDVVRLCQYAESL